MQDKKMSLGVPIAIIIAGLVIAGAIVYPDIKNGGDTSSAEGEKTTEVENEVIEQKDAILSQGHVLGKADAKVTIAEFSDPECPYCGRFHVTMEQIMQKYGTDGDVAWRYIYFFPFDSNPQAHPLSRPLAAAIECAAQVGGEEMYWKYTKLVFEQEENDRSYDIPGNAQTLGIDIAAFNACLEDPAIAEKVSAQHSMSASLGLRGTPHSIVILEDGTGYRINGAYPYQTVDMTIQAALAGVPSGKIQKFLDMFQESGMTEEKINAYVATEFTPAIEAAQK